MKYAGRNISSGYTNVIIGNNAGCNSVTAYCNVFIGDRAGRNVTCTGGTAFHNVYVGSSAGLNLVCGCNNTFFGHCAGYGTSGANGSDNVFLGNGAGFYINGGNANVSIGHNAGRGICGGVANIAIGRESSYNLQSGDYNIVLGQKANCNRTSGNDNIILGRSAGTALSPTNSNCNIFIGAYSSGGSGCGSTCAACHNIGIGYCTIAQVRNNDNIAIGRYAGCGSSTAGYNISIGPFAGANPGGGGNCNIAIGCAAGQGTYGNNNVFLGNCTGCSSSSSNAACDNTIIGNCAGSSTIGQRNTFLGHLAGNTTTTGCCNVAIGYDVELPTAAGNDQMAIGSGTNRWIYGDSSFNIYDKDGNQLNGGLSVTDDTTTNSTRYLIFANGTSGSITPQVSSSKLSFNPSTGNLVVGGTVTANSDERLKTNIRGIPDALDKLLRLRGVEFDRTDIQDRQIGVIAQEVEEVIPEVVYGSDIKSVAYANMVALLIEAVKEQNLKIEEQSQKIADLESRIGG